MANIADYAEPKWKEPEKAPLSRLLQFEEVLKDVAVILEYGEFKHGQDQNYLTYPLDKDIDAALRHTFKNKSEGVDPETGKSHLAHAVTRLLFATYKEKLEKDNA